MSPMWPIVWLGPFIMLGAIGFPLGESKLIYWSWGLWTGWYLVYGPIITEGYIPLFTYLFN